MSQLHFTSTLTSLSLPRTNKLPEEASSEIGDFGTRNTSLVWKKIKIGPVLRSVDWMIDFMVRKEGSLTSRGCDVQTAHDMRGRIIEHRSDFVLCIVLVTFSTVIGLIVSRKCEDGILGADEEV